MQAAWQSFTKLLSFYKLTKTSSNDDVDAMPSKQASSHHKALQLSTEKSERKSTKHDFETKRV